MTESVFLFQQASTVDLMTALPADAGLNRTTLQRTVRAVRAALPESKRVEFMAELDDADAGGLSAVLDRWWTRAVVWSNPTAMAKLAAADAGQLEFVPIEQVFPQFPRVDD